MFKKIVSLVLAAVMVVTFLSGNVDVQAAKSKSKTQNVSIARVWDGTADTSWFTTLEGQWNEADKESYDISTAEELAGLCELANSAKSEGRPFGGVVINLTNDIVLNDTTDWEKWVDNPPANKWTPIGEEGSFAKGYRPFIGTFNGNGHTISGMYIDGGKFAGLFGYIENGAQICNLRIEKSVITGGGACGFIVGTSHASMIANCEVRDCILTSSNGGGGLVGKSECQLGGGTALSHIFLAITLGVVFNPLLTGGYEDKDLPEGGTIISGCKVSNCKFLGVSSNWENPDEAGVILDAADEDVIIDTLVEGCEFNSSNTWFESQFRNQKGKNVAYITANTKGLVENCYAVNNKRIDGETSIIDAGMVTETTLKKAVTEKFAKKVGKAFSYKEGSTPVISTMKDPNITVGLTGNKAVLSWKPVEGATKYKVYYVYKGKTTSVTTKTPSVTLEKLKKGGKYSVVIRAFYGDKKNQKIYGGKFEFKA